MKDITRRLKRLAVAPELVAHLGIGTYRVIGNAVPDDARFVGACYDEKVYCFIVVLQHDSWPEVAEGVEIPLMHPPTIERLVSQ